MRIGVDATCWQNKRIYGRQARGLLTSLPRLDVENCYTFLIDSIEEIENMPPEDEVVLVRASARTAVAASSSGYRSSRDMWHMSRAMSDPSFDLLIFPTIYSYVPIFGRVKKLVMIHDVIAEIFPHLTLASQTAPLFWKGKVAVGRWQANAIATVSEYSRQIILKRFKITPERIIVVGEASDPIFRSMDHPCPTLRLESLGIPVLGGSVWRTLAFHSGWQ